MCRVVVSLLALSSAIMGQEQGKYDRRKKDLVPYPDLFIIGAQKCGTTSLNSLLYEHRQICNKGVKEKHFYTESDFAENVKDYMKEFKGCKPSQLTVDATPKYVVGSEIAERIESAYTAESLAKKKFVLLLRDPVARQYSEYQRGLRICFRVIDGDEQLLRQSSIRTPEEKVARAEKNCELAMRPNTLASGDKLSKDNAMLFAEWVTGPFGSMEQARGNYVSQIKHWLRVINRSQIFIMNFQTLVGNTTDAMHRLSDFLGIQFDEFLNNQNKSQVILPKPPPSNSYVTWAPAFMDCKTHDMLDKYYKEQNVGLLALINDDPRKPKEEPYFPAFTSARSKCKESMESS